MDDPRVIALRIPNLSPEGRNQVYVLKSDPITIIDTGIATQKAFDAIVAGLAEHGLSVSDVKRVLLTHKHIDHIGNAWRFHRESEAEILIHEDERHAVTDVDPEGGRHAELVRQRAADWSLPPEEVPQPNPARRGFWQIESVEAIGIGDGQRIATSDGELEVIHTPGHTMGSVCFRLDRLLFSGDHVLPTISPNVGGGDMRNRNLLQHFLNSLERIVAMAGDVDWVLPGHGAPFQDLAARCDALVAHHTQRLGRVVEILEGGGEHTVYEVACKLFGDMEDFHVVLGCAEAASHLEHLEHEGRVVSQERTFALT